MVTFSPSEKVRFALSLSQNILGIRHHVINVGKSYINEWREAHQKGVKNLFVFRRYIQENWCSINRYRDVIKANIHLIDVPHRVIRNTQRVFYR